MDIKITALDRTPVTEQDARPTRWQITIDVDSTTDDPAGHLWGLAAVHERLESVLRLIGEGHGVRVADDGDLWGLLVDAGTVAARLDSMTTALMWAARDTHGKTWGEIASAIERPRKSVRNLVERARDFYAGGGYWRDEDGLHHEDDPETAKARAWARAAELSGRLARGGSGDEAAETMTALGVEIEPNE